jgi:cytochrome c biogenesis protein CcmG, thiol:disulfide interchange protein DsbE
MQQQIHQHAPRQRGRSVKHPLRRPLARLLAQPRTVLAGLGLLVAVVVLIGATQPGGAPDTASLATGPEIGLRAPDFSLAALDGAPRQLSGLRGQVVLINFWATWCPPCRAEMPAIEAAYERYRGQGFTVLAVTADANPAGVAAFTQEHALTFPALLDQDGAVHATYFARGLPSSFFIDRQGVVRAIHRGQMTEDVVADEVARLIAEH